MDAIVYALVTLIALICSILLMRRYRKSGASLLLWSAVCFAGLTIANAALFADLVMLPGVDLLNLRLAITASALLLLVVGFILEGG